MPARQPAVWTVLARPVCRFRGRAAAHESTSMSCAAILQVEWGANGGDAGGGPPVGRPRMFRAPKPGVSYPRTRRSGYEPARLRQLDAIWLGGGDWR